MSSSSDKCIRCDKSRQSGEGTDVCFSDWMWQERGRCGQNIRYEYEHGREYKCKRVWLCQSCWNHSIFDKMDLHHQ